MRSLITNVSIAAGLIGWATAATAQEVYVQPSYGSTYYSYDADADSDYVVRPAPRYGTRVYGYERRYRAPDDAVVIETDPRLAGHCGTYRFWDGVRCRDARNR